MTMAVFVVVLLLTVSCAKKYPEVRFGLTTNERIAVYHESNEVAKTGESEVNSQISAIGNTKRRDELTREIGMKYMQELADKHNITYEQLIEIAFEGTERNWPE